MNKLECPNRGYRNDRIFVIGRILGSERPSSVHPLKMSIPPTKRRKVDQSNGKLIKQLEADLTDAINQNGSLNSLADLVALTKRCESAEDTSKAIYALYRVSVLLATGGRLFGDGEESGKLVRAWLWEQLNTYVDVLSGLLKDEEKSLRVRY
jgi:U3 small nucleolar RNA-associated protein 19